MQRVLALRGLSRDHHTALVLARRARMAAQQNPAVAAAAWDEITRRFPAELEPHFRIEERHLLPPLGAVGEGALVDRTLREHGSMRALIADNRPANLLPFADLLEAHVRFEEKDLFETAQRKLPPEALEAVEHIQTVHQTESPARARDSLTSN